MKQIKYGDSSYTLRLEYPSEWWASTFNTGGLTVTITSSEGTEIVAATAATIYTATTTNATASAGDTTVTLANTATAVVAGDRLEIASSAAGPAEQIEVAGYNTSTKVATLKRPLVYDHTNGTAVYGRWATYAVNASSSTNYPKGHTVTALWTPACDYTPVVELYEIVSEETLLSGLRERFRDLFPVEYRRIETRWDVVYDQAQSELWIALRARNLDSTKVVDPKVLEPTLLRYVRWLAVESGGDADSVGREVAWNSYTTQFELLCGQPFWVDADQDLTADDDETTDHEFVFSRGL